MSSIDVERPLVSVRCPQIWDPPRRRYVTVGEAIELHCSHPDCGELTDWESLSRRAHLQWQARQHSIEHHDGIVDAEGWAR